MSNKFKILLVIMIMNDKKSVNMFVDRYGQQFIPDNHCRR